MLRSLTEKAGTLASRVKDRVESTFSKHSGASDVVVVRHADGELRSSPWRVHCFDVSVQSHATRVQVRLCIGGRPTELFLVLGKDHQCYFQPPDLEGVPGSCIPSESQLQMLPLAPGRNAAVFEVRQLEEDTQRWSVQSEIGADLFLWEATDRVVAFDYEGGLLRPDAWAKEARQAIQGQRKAAEWDGRDKSVMREGAGSLLSSLQNSGYRLLFTTSSPISRMDHIRSAMSSASRAEVDRWGAHAQLPDVPVLCGTDHTAAVLASRLTSKALAVAGRQGKQAAFLQSSFTLIADLFRAQDAGRGGGGGGLAGGFCRIEDVEAFLSAGVPPAGMIVVDRLGTLRAPETGHDGVVQKGTWTSFGDVPVADLFPPLREAPAGSRGVPPSPGVLLL